MKTKDFIKLAIGALTTWIVLVHQAPGTKTTTGTTTAASAVGDVTMSSDVEDSAPSSIKKAWSYLMDQWKKNQTPCCQELFRQYEVSTITDGKMDLPAVCMLDGAECPAYNIYARTTVTSAMVDGETMPCIDSEGNARTSSAVDADTLFNADDIDLPLCLDEYTSLHGRAWWWWAWAVHLFYGGHVFGILYTACLPLRFGDMAVRPYETMTTRRLLLAVSSLWLVSGGGSLIFIISEIHMLHWMWILRGTTEGFVLVTMFALYTFMVMRPLPYRFPEKEFLKHELFALWREFFDFRAVNEFGQAVDVEALTKDDTYLLAQLPHAIMPFGAILGSSVLPELLPTVWPVSGVVASALLQTPVLRHFINYLGVREAGTKSIHQMFADGYQAVGVVTGGIAEMFVSRKIEALTGIRRGFAHIAIKGGHSIIPIFVFGASLTHSVFPLFNNRFFKWLSRKGKAPVMLFWGAFGLVPHRQQLKMVVGRPIAVEQRTEGVTGEDAQALCNTLQAAVVDIYNRKKPFWETRDIEFQG